MRLGIGGERLEMCKLDSAEIIRNENLNVNSVEEDGNLEKSKNEPPATVLSTLNQSQRKAFIRLWDNIPVHLQAIHFDFEESLWTETDIDDLGSLLSKYAHRFSKHSTDLGHVTVDPFRIILRKDAQPVKQRPYRHSQY